MFVRFRTSARRLDLSLIEAARRSGKPRHEHVASLGSIAQPPTVADRIAFWRKLHERLAKLSNRIDAETHGHVLGAVHRRIPMVTADEQREVQLANAQAEAATWEAVATMYESTAADTKTLVASAERSVAANSNAAKAATEIAEAAKDKLARIERGEMVAGLGKPVNLASLLAEAGFTKADFRRMRRSAEFTEEQFEAVLTEKHRRARQASNWLPRNGSELAAVVAAQGADRSKA